MSLVESGLGFDNIANLGTVSVAVAVAVIVVVVVVVVVDDDDDIDFAVDDVVVVDLLSFVNLTTEICNGTTTLFH